MRGGVRRLTLWCALVFATLPHHALSSPSQAGAADGSPDACAPTAGLHFICNVQRPEDLIVLPGERWLITSGYAERSGLHVVDVERKTARRVRWPADALADSRWGACGEPLDPDRLQAHGLALSESTDGTLRLFVVNHGTRESVEVFDVELSDAEPQLIWRGCILAPDGMPLNGVVATAEGTLLATVSTLRGHAFHEAFEGKLTGAVFEWRSPASGFREIPGTRLPGNNGIELSRDGRQVYVLAAPARSVTAFRRGESWRRLWTVRLPSLYPDNIHWGVDRRLYVAGMSATERACGGPVKVVNNAVDLVGCRRSYRVLTIDPTSRAVRQLASGDQADGFHGASSALPAGDYLWIGSWWDGRLAYRPWKRASSDRP